VSQELELGIDPEQAMPKAVPDDGAADGPADGVADGPSQAPANDLRAVLVSDSRTASA